MSDIVKQEPVAVVPMDFGQIVAAAVDKGIDAASLERLLGVYERVKAGNAAQEFARAMGAFRSECPPVERRSNTQFRVNRNGVEVVRKYASLEDIERVVRPHLAKNGLSFRWDSSVLDGSKLTLACVVTHEGGHSERSQVTMPIDSKAGCSEQQKMGIAYTYAQRYSLIQALGITTADEDNDGAEERTQAEKITEHQLANLECLISEVAADRAKFLRFMGINILADLPASKFSTAVQALESKRGKQ